MKTFFFFFPEMEAVVLVEEDMVIPHGLKVGATQAKGRKANKLRR